MDYTLIGFVLYLFTILVVGFLSYKANKSHQDFFIAGRKLNPWVVAFSERASGESAWLLLGLPGIAYAVGMLESWTALGCVLGIILYWFVIAQKLREETEQYNSITLPDFFAQKLGRYQKRIRITATLIIIFFFTFYLSAQFNGAGKVLNVTFGIDQQWGIVLGAAVIVLYTMAGGFFAVAWTDMIQGIIMIGALVVLPVVGLYELSLEHKSIGAAMNEVGSNFMSPTGGKKGWVGVAVAVSGLSWAFGYMGQPHLLTRFMSIQDSNKIKISRRIAIAWAIPAFAGAFVIGLVGLAYYGSGQFADAEFVMPQLANDLLPAWLAGIFVSAAVAAMMSTADSQLLVITSSVIEDIYHKTLGRDVSDKQLLLLSRLITIAVGVFGFFIAITSQELIFEMVSYAWAGLGASFGPALLMMLWWKGTTPQGVWAGMITGTLTTIIWSNLPIDEILSVRLVSFVFAFIAVILVSVVTKAKSNE